MNYYSLKRRTHRCKQETNLTGYRCRLRWKYRILVKMIFVQIMLSVIFLAITSFCSRMLSICRGLLPSMNFKVYWKVNQKNQRKIKHFSSFGTKTLQTLFQLLWCCLSCERGRRSLQLRTQKWSPTLMPAGVVLRTQWGRKYDYDDACGAGFILFNQPSLF